MVGMLMQIPYEEFLKIEDKYKYAVECEYISIKTVGVTKRNLYKEFDVWADWYAIFSDKPLYFVVMQNKSWYKITKGTKLLNTFKFTKWKYIPRNESEITNTLPIDKRMWNDFEYFEKVCEKICQNNFNKNPVVEVKLDGSSTDYIIHEEYE